MRQLSRRNPRHSGRSRNSMASDAAMLNVEAEQKRQEGLRSRSVSATSGLLLNRPAGSDHRQSLGPDSVTAGGHSHTGSTGAPYTPTTPAGGAGSTYSYPPGSSQGGTHRGSMTGGIANLKAAEPTGPYFRQPRPRKNTLDMQSPGSRSRGSWTSGDWTKLNSPEPDDSPDFMERGASISGRDTPLPAYLGGSRERVNSTADDSPRTKTDYATREVDYYYGVRGPALSHMPTRRLKTGPADPEGPVSSATGWFKNLFGGKTKEKGKGFEVVRSSRMPPHQQTTQDGEIALEDQEPYKDDPEVEGIPRAIGRPRNLELDDEGDAVGGGTRRLPSGKASPASSEGEDNGDDGFVSDDEDRTRVSPIPPMLPDIEVGGSINIPSRYASQASSRPSRINTQRERDLVPAVPRRSSKRTPSLGNSNDFNFQDHNARLSVIPSSPPTTPQASLTPDWPLGSSNSQSQRLPFSGLDPGTARAHHRTASGGSMMSAGSALTSHSNENVSRTHTPPSESRLGALPGFRDERPSSMGYVQQHRASDHIHVVKSSEQIFSGSTAELVDDGSGRTPSSDAGRPST